jgi:20S proteasome alpha/beta subunit
MAFIPNPHFEEQFVREAQPRAAMLALAQKVKNAAAAAVDDDTGHYASTLVTGSDDDGAYVATTDVAGHIIEWGSANNPPLAPIRRGVIAAGLSLEEDPKP